MRKLLMLSGVVGLMAVGAAPAQGLTWQVTHSWSIVEYPNYAHQINSGAATCPANTTLTGGGVWGSWTADYPTEFYPDGNTWRVWESNPTGNLQGFYVVAMCLSISG